MKGSFETVWEHKKMTIFFEILSIRMSSEAESVFVWNGDFSLL